MLKNKEYLLLEIAKKVFKSKNLKINFGPEKISSWDSINHIRFILEIEKKFKKKITFEQSLTISKIKDVLKFIK